MADSVKLRLATPNDATILATHRVTMFREMGTVAPAQEPELMRTSTEYFRSALASGEYVGWVAVSGGEPEQVVGGAGVQFRPLLPRPNGAGRELLLGREGLVLNVYVEHGWRRQGIARRLLDEIMHWAPGAGIVRLSLHASKEGRPLYEAMGFASSNEMRVDLGGGKAARR